MSTTITSRFNVPVPSTDLLTYIFDSPWDERTPSWTDDQPLVVSAGDDDAPSCSFDKLKLLVKCFACGLSQRARPGARVVIYGTLSTNLPTVLLGAIGAEASCNICPAHPLAEAVERLRTVGADFVFFAPEHLGLMVAAAAEAGLLASQLFIVDDIDVSLTETAQADGAVSHWSVLLDRQNGPSYLWRKLSPEEARTTTALLTHTSGTTGLPKLAERTHYGLVGNIAQLLYRYHLKPRGGGPHRETWLCTFLYVGIGFILYGLLLPLKARYRTIVLPRFTPEAFMAAARKYQATALHVPKHHLQTLLLHARGADFTTVTSLRTGGAMIPYRMCEEWMELHGSPCEVVCGMTEGGIRFASDPRVIETDGTIGELLPNLEAKVVDLKEGRVLGRGEPGEICIRNPFIMKGYLGKVAETAAVFTEDGFIKTGDIGMVNESGRWYILGRIKDMFKHGGNHVMAAEIELAILNHPDVLEVVVVPVKLESDDDEPVPRGYLVRKTGSSLTVQEFLHWMLTSLSARLQLLAGVEFLDALPVSSGGKIDRNALREKAAQDAQTEGLSQPCLLN
ncbi:AMP-binding enzyme [Aspergillus indologenus CBS 114.80]|uniref:AMP-binding enzyme n=1 Tax=Aspergillus indologenus CBS 114.80 TaxID=1450541 RepID=A0A2V5I1E5_9EURO|nr:AMP-binding enzyme [Aspergillus indologenus CBS 114.80]